MTNILILSCGTRNKIVQYFQEALIGQGQVFAADCSPLAPALYEADHYFIVPRMDESGYMEYVLKLCEQYQITAVLSLIDPELSLLAEYKEAFLEIGTVPLISDIEAVARCLNKYEMYTFLRMHQLSAVPSYIDLVSFEQDMEDGLIHFPVFVKPMKGSASQHIHQVSSKEELALLWTLHEELMIQPFVDADEYGADVYIDLLTEEPVAIFTKQKLKMRAGETDKAVSVKDEALFGLIQRFVKVSGLTGVIDVDLFKIGEQYVISEVNPRFGGGYPHAYESGVHFPQMLLHNLQGEANPQAIGQYEAGFYMMKYNEIQLIKEGAPVAR